MTLDATITKDGRTLARGVQVDVEEVGGGYWMAVFEADAGGAGSVDGEAFAVETAETFRLALSDGREGEFVPARQVGHELGAAVVMARGVGPLRRKPACGCGG